MSGPLTSAVFLLLSFTLLLPPRLLLEAKSLSGSRSSGGIHRLRRELRDTLPYEAQMMSYPPAGGAEGRGNELYYPPEGWRGQAMGQALQRLAEDDRRRDQEAAYLSGLLRLLGDGDANGPRAGEEEEEEEDEAEQEGPGDFQGPYPPDYDETDQGLNMAKPQAAWQGLLDPQLTQALLNRYRQERLLRAGLRDNRLQEARGEPGTDAKEEEVLRYLVGRVLSSLASDATQNAPARLSRRDLGAVGGDGAGGRVLKRSRRSADPAPLPPSKSEASLLRVKRLGDDEDKMAAGAAAAAAMAGARGGGGGGGLQRIKRIDADLQQGGRHVRRRRALTYDPNLLAQRILQYLPQ
ncbi:proprotein convertase subtilisin/kexin type 1 inhibitor, like [Anguilla anguilla]|uniref:proprotein convertase subtilisin/kexin type 1 inhibitor, like n=1 Tax=Anguilla anguilla TaxID=7936 RepID=UPI0015B0EC9E|nr:proprotein convertase subtilisin/kexin type 1 inhibitor, like [Anguilla anguilla]